MPEPVVVSSGDPPEHEVQEILRFRLCRGHPQCLVRWVGKDVSGDTWEPVEHLTNCESALRDFEAAQGISVPRPQPPPGPLAPRPGPEPPPGFSSAGRSCTTGPARAAGLGGPALYQTSVLARGGLPAQDFLSARHSRLLVGLCLLWQTLGAPFGAAGRGDPPRRPAPGPAVSLSPESPVFFLFFFCEVAGRGPWVWVWSGDRDSCQPPDRQARLTQTKRFSHRSMSLTSHGESPRTAP